MQEPQEQAIWYFKEYKSGLDAHFWSYAFKINTIAVELSWLLMGFSDTEHEICQQSQQIGVEFCFSIVTVLKEREKYFLFNTLEKFSFTIVLFLVFVQSRWVYWGHYTFFFICQNKVGKL